MKSSLNCIQLSIKIRGLKLNSVDIRTTYIHVELKCSVVWVKHWNDYLNCRLIFLAHQSTKGWIFGHSLGVSGGKWIVISNHICSAWFHRGVNEVFFWDLTRRWLVDNYWCFGTTHRTSLQGSRNPVLLDSWRWLGRPETLVINY
jgi:hypothetical protein